MSLSSSDWMCRPWDDNIGTAWKMKQTLTLLPKRRLHWINSCSYCLYYPCNEAYIKYGIIICDMFNRIFPLLLSLLVTLFFVAILHFFTQKVNWSLENQRKIESFQNSIQKDFFGNFVLLRGDVRGLKIGVPPFYENTFREM